MDLFFKWKSFNPWKFTTFLLLENVENERLMWRKNIFTLYQPSLHQFSICSIAIVFRALLLSCRFVFLCKSCLDEPWGAEAPRMLHLCSQRGASTVKWVRETKHPRWIRERCAVWTWRFMFVCFYKKYDCSNLISSKLLPQIKDVCLLGINHRKCFTNVFIGKAFR